MGVILTVSVAAQSVHRDIAIEDDREPAPRFHAKTLEGEQFTNDSTKGKVVLISVLDHVVSVLQERGIAGERQSPRNLPIRVWSCSRWTWASPSKLCSNI